MGEIPMGQRFSGRIFHPLGLWGLSLVPVLCVMWRSLASSCHLHPWASSPWTTCCPPSLLLLFWVGWGGWMRIAAEMESLLAVMLAGEISPVAHKGLRHGTRCMWGLTARC